MLRRLATFVLVLAAIVFAPPAANAVTTPDGALRIELTTRRDHDFAGTLTKPQKKQQKAVTQSLGFLLPYLEQNLADRIGTAGKVA